jgi:hypothetical protein
MDSCTADGRPPAQNPWTFLNLLLVEVQPPADRTVASRISTDHRIDPSFQRQSPSSIRSAVAGRRPRIHAIRAGTMDLG